MTNEYIFENSSKYVEIRPSNTNFWRDVFPYYSPLIITVCLHLTYFYTGNMLLPAWLMYIGTPLYNLILLDDGNNVDKKNEKIYTNNK